MEFLSLLRDMGLLTCSTCSCESLGAFGVLYTVCKGAVSRFFGSTLKPLKHIGIKAKTQK